MESEYSVQVSVVEYSAFREVRLRVWLQRQEAWRSGDEEFKSENKKLPHGIQVPYNDK